MLKKKFFSLQKQNPTWRSLLLINKSMLRLFINRVSTLIWKFSGVEVGKGSIIEWGVHINCPKQVILGENCIIKKGTKITSEIPGDGILDIKNNVQINRGVHLDITGELIIYSNTLISENAQLYTHDHGYNPKSPPICSKLIVEGDVWIGSKVTILSKVNKVNSKSIIGACSLVTKEVCSSSLYAGVPAKLIKKIPSEKVYR